MKKLSIQPLSDRVLIKPLENAGEKKLASGIILPPANNEKPVEGQVVAVGPGRYSDTGHRLPMEVKVGDKVYFKKPWEEPIKIDDVEYYVLSESEITLIKK
ncbi:MAG: co-chaperone GroES [bacterium]|nr:co-chaperone GroES [bacterium]